MNPVSFEKLVTETLMEGGPEVALWYEIVQNPAAIVGVAGYGISPLSSGYLPHG